MDRLVLEHIEDIRRIARQHGATRIRVVGSRARGDSRGDSDLDLLIDMEKGRSLLDMVAIQQDLEDFLGCKVDVGSEFDPLLGDEPLRHAVEL